MTSSKVSTPGKALCVICNKLTNYAARGFESLEQHSQSASHIENLGIRKTNNSIKGMFGTGSSLPQTLNPKIEPVCVPMCDRIGNLEAL